jgi:hypothetical protein
MEQIESESELFKYFQKEWSSIVEKLIDASTQETELKRIKDIFQQFNCDYKDYKKDDIVWGEKLKNTIYRIFKIKSNEIVNNKKDSIYSEEDFDRMEEQVSEYFYTLSVNYYPHNVEIEQEYFPCDEIDREDLISDNLLSIDESESHSDDWNYSEKAQDNTENMIDELFTMFER